VGKVALTRLALCRTPHRDRRFAADVQRVADACDISPAPLANVLRTVEVLTDWVGATASQPQRHPQRDRDGSDHGPTTVDHKHLEARPRLLAAARDTAEERTVVDLPPTGTSAVPRWLARAVEVFWGEVAPPSGFPRDLELPLLTGLPVAVVELPGLTVAALAGWLAERHLPTLTPIADRPLRACLLAYAGVGVVFVDTADTPAQRRVSLAHEGGHLIVDYLLPRQEVARRRPDLLDVLDGSREPTADERVEAAAFDVPIGVHTHLQERTPDGHWHDAPAGRAEQHAELVALELLAPQQEVLQRAQQANLDSIEELAALLEGEFGLPPATAARHAGQLARLRPPRPRGLLGLLDLRDPTAARSGQNVETAADAATDSTRDDRRSGDEPA